ncbi:MAG: cysteine--tRNA ligase, partial [Acidimicrobiales bacterium]
MTMLRLYDTLSGEIRPLELREEGRVSLYACGPTVYDHPHLGHARQAITYDVLRRYLEWRGLQVHHVANVTDVDDNIIARARREGSTEAEVAAVWEEVYDEAMDAIDVLRPHDRPHATDYVDQMVTFVADLVDRGSAYVTDSGVYLRVRAIDAYGALVHRTPDQLAEGSGARVEIDETKDDPLDFALWKTAKPDEPSWPSPWGPGRPGWHIECATMSLHILGDGFDLHGGGDDLVFPHHTNERAEAIAAGRPFARHWVHNAMVNVGGEKMSKSLGNFSTIADLLVEHPLNGRALRLLILQTHYRKTMEINPDVMGQARSAVERLDAMARKAVSAGVPLGGVTRDALVVPQVTDDLTT